MCNIDNYFKDIVNINNTIERMFEPYKEVIKDINNQNKKYIKHTQGATSQAVFAINTTELFDEKIESIRKINENLAGEINQAIEPMQNINFIPDNLIISKFLVSYNSIKNLIDNFEKYEVSLTKNQLNALNKIKKNNLFTIDIEAEIDNFSNEQKRTFKDYIKQSYKKIAKKLNDEEITEETSKFIVTLQVEDNLSNISSGIEDYLIIIEALTLFIK